MLSSEEVFKLCGTIYGDYFFQRFLDEIPRSLHVAEAEKTVLPGESRYYDLTIAAVHAWVIPPSFYVLQQMLHISLRLAGNDTECE